MAPGPCCSSVVSSSMPQLPSPRSLSDSYAQPGWLTSPLLMVTSADPAVTLKSTVPVRSDDTGEVIAMGAPWITPVSMASWKVVVPSEIDTAIVAGRTEEHTYALQSLTRTSYAYF